MVSLYCIIALSTSVHNEGYASRRANNEGTHGGPMNPTNARRIIGCAHNRWARSNTRKTPRSERMQKILVGGYKRYDRDDTLSDTLASDDRMIVSFARVSARGSAVIYRERKLLYSEKSNAHTIPLHSIEPNKMLSVLLINSKILYNYYLLFFFIFFPLFINLKYF